ncbi:MAG: hypothetical protein ACRDRZ_03580, partial [Pseudonocardiaceae bacterium]
MFERVDAALLRTPAWQPPPGNLPWPDMGAADPGADDGTDLDACLRKWSAWLRLMWQLDGFADAVELASPA